MEPEKEEGVSDDEKFSWFIKKLQLFNVSWRSFFIIIATLTTISIVLIVWTQTCCEEKNVYLARSTPMSNSPLDYNCTQLVYDYNCCRIKNFWNPFSNACIRDYQPIFLTECLQIPWWEGFDSLIVIDSNGTVLRDDTHGFPKDQIKGMNPLLQKVYTFFYGVRD